MDNRTFDDRNRESDNPTNSADADSVTVGMTVEGEMMTVLVAVVFVLVPAVVLVAVKIYADGESRPAGRLSVASDVERMGARNC